MSPTEIPGDILKFLTPVGEKKCPNPLCRRDYCSVRLKQSDGIVFTHCPHCNYIIGQYSVSTLLEMAAKGGK
jgi:RNase P subunit RPR2